jgi:hypothetical protein
MLAINASALKLSPMSHSFLITYHVCGCMFFRHAPAGFHYMLTDVCDLLVTAFGDYRPSTFEQRNQAVDFILHLIKVRLIPAHTCGAYYIAWRKRAACSRDRPRVLSSPTGVPQQPAAHPPPQPPLHQRPRECIGVSTPSWPTPHIL